MGDLISRSALVKEINEKSKSYLNEWDTMGVLIVIDRQPTVEAEPVVHGKWNGVEHDMFFECSICGYLTDYMLTNYCPKCGAKMGG